MEARSRKKRAADGFARICRICQQFGPFPKKRSQKRCNIKAFRPIPTHWRECVARLLGLAFMQGLGKNLQKDPTQLHPFGGRRIQLRCAPSPPPCLGMFGWSAGGSVGLHASQLVNQRTSEEVNQSTNQLVSQSTNQKSTPKSTTSGPTQAENLFKIGPSGGLGGSWGLLGRVLGRVLGNLGGLGEGLGGLGGHVGSRMGPRAQTQFVGPPWMLTSSIKHSILGKNMLEKKSCSKKSHVYARICEHKYMICNV